MDANTLLQNVFAFVVQPIIWVLFGVAFIVFIWGIVEFIRDAGSEEGRIKGKRSILWGVLGMVIMISVLGITNVIRDSIVSYTDVPIDDPQGDLNLR